MNRNSKKGFTIVELIIVIAVIAVLAAVLIPTFSNLIQKAQEAKDTALVRNLNEALAMDTSVSKHTTMDQVAQAVRNNGIDIAKIKASVPGNAILWDSVNDLFAYCKVDKDGNAEDQVYYIPEYSANAPALGRLFAVVSDSSAVATSKYGVYYIGSAVPSLEINGVGFDAGDAEIGEVIYNGSSSGAIADIRTNGGKLTIKGAGKDDVNHHGVALGVTIEEVKEGSYHEYGEVQGNIELKKGHVVLENTAKVGTIIVNPTENANVSVGTNGGTVGAVVKKQGVTATIDSKLTTTEVTAEQETEMKKFAGGIGTEASPYLIETAEQLKEISNFDGKSFKQVKNIEIVSRDYTGICLKGNYDGNGNNITLGEYKDDKNVLYLFAIGQNAKISNLNVYSQPTCLLSVAELSTEIQSLTIANVTTYVVGNETAYISQSNSSPFINEAIYFEAENPGKVYVTFENCVNNANIQNSGDCTGVFWGSGPYYGINNSNYVEGVESNNSWAHTKYAVEYYVTLNNCTNNGNITSKSQCGIVFGNSAGIGWGLKAGYTAEELIAMIKINNVENYGTLSYINEGGASGVFTHKTMEDKYSYLVKNHGKYTKSNNVLAGKDVSIYFDENGNLSIVGDGLKDAYQYELQITLPNLEMSATDALMGRAYKATLKLATSANGTKLSTKDSNFALKAYNYDELQEATEIDPSTLKYDFLFENTCYMAMKITSNGLYVVAAQLPEGKTYPKFASDNIYRLTVYAYDKDGNFVGNIIYNK